MTNQEKLKIALLEVYTEQSNEMLRKGDFEWDYTNDYQFVTKLEKLINHQKRSYWKYVNTVGKRVAIIIVALVVAFSSAMTVPAFREPVVEFVVKTYEKFSAYFASEETLNATNNMPQKIEEYYAPTYLPNGFEKIELTFNEQSSFGLWENISAQQEILFSQNLVALQSNLNTEDTAISKFILGDKEIFTYSKNNVTSYLWTDGIYSFNLNVPSDLSQNEILRIINGIKRQ